MMTSMTTLRRLLCALLLPVLFTPAAVAQASGPTQSEFTVPSGGGGGAHVDEFTGSFGYDIPLLQVPGPHGSGFDVTLSYHGGMPITEDVSWVGYGWAVNAGAVVRDRRGLPDDWQDTVTYWNKLPRTFMVTASRKVNLEITSEDYNKLLNLAPDPKSGDSTKAGTIAMTLTTAFSNRTGFSNSYSIGAWAKGLMSLNYTLKEDSPHFNWSVDPHDALHYLQEAGATQVSLDLGNTLTNLNQTYRMVRSLFTAGEQRIPSAGRAPMNGESSNFSATFLLNALPWFLNGFELGASGNFTAYASEPQWKRRGVGYMYSWRAGSADVMDYYSERDGSYKKADMFLPIPLTNADNFIVSGGGTAGSFRLYNHGVGTFHPNVVSTDMSIGQYGVDFHAGTRFGIGGHLGIGRADYDLSSWGDAADNPAYRFEGPGDKSPYVFRFHNDLGGKVEFAPNDDAVRADINSSGLLGIIAKTPKVPMSIDPSMNNGDFWGSAVFVGHHTNAEMLQKTDRGVYYNSYTKDARTRGFVNRGDSKLKEQIGEYCIVGKDGNRFVYGLPVYVRNEKTISMGLGNTIHDSADRRLSAGHIAYRYTSTDMAETVVGEERNGQYASTYLLTEITTPDYLDRTNNGPSPDDFGGYTKFNYVEVAGYNYDYSTYSALNPLIGPILFSAPWFKWRVPYNGLYYAKNGLSDRTDDFGSYMSGEKQMYYLQSIETKTHIAYFVTNKTNILVNGHRIKGSQIERQDGYQAYHPATSTSGIPAMERRTAGDSTVSGADYTTSGTPHPPANIAQRLERIELYAKDAAGKPGQLLRTVFMEYDYSLRRGMPNSIHLAAPPDTTRRAGMLTLTKLWWQGENVVNSSYSPYLFGYAYRRNSSYASEIQTRYHAVTHFADSLPAKWENPDYSAHDVDRWGCYQYNGGARSAAMNPWVDQTPDTTKFDPAAWQLKWIKTPSQGELQVQYEQNRYSYVQDRPAMAMVSLKTVTSDSVHSDDGSNPPKYILNLADIGIADTAQYAMKRLQSLIRRTFVDVPPGGVKERVYFKLLYALQGTAPSVTDNTRQSEYITGYAHLDDVGIESISGTSPTQYRMFVKLKSGGEVPREICRDFVRKNRRGLMGEHDAIEDNGNALAMVGGLLDEFPGFDANDYCRAINYPGSYIRLPLLEAKKGGGIRVKRLLTLDRGLESDPQLTGAEYIYEDFDESRHEYIGSGVASNEPAIGREENALVRIPAEADGPDVAGRIIAGAEKARYEGPLGESLMPGAGVGYSRVVTRNIHSGVSNPGFSIARFYTAKDYPFVEQYPGIGKSTDHTDIASKSFQLLPIISTLASKVVPGLGIQIYDDELWLTQGYRFILNDMHGRFRSRATYAGKYSGSTDTLAMTSLQEVTYFAPGEKVPMLQHVGDTIRYSNPGKEMEVAMETRSASDDVSDGSVEGDLSIQSFIPFDFQPSGKLYLSHTHSSLATHVTSKVVRYPAIAKGTVSYADGIYHYTRYEAFDPLSGAPVITHTTDGYDKLHLQMASGGGVQNGAYHLHTFPASEQYLGMGQKATNEHQILKSGGALRIGKYTPIVHELLITPNNLATFDPNILCQARAMFAQGDLVRLRKHSDTTQYRGFYHVDSVIIGNILEVSLKPVSEAHFASLNTDSGEVDVEFIRSGYANQLGTSAGSIMTYGVSDEVIARGDATGQMPTGVSGLQRQNLANMLNPLINAHATGTILTLTPALLLGMGVKLKDYNGDTCGAVALIVSKNSDSEVVLTTQFSPPIGEACGTTLLGQPGKGAFRINNEGRLVFYASPTTCCPQTIPCVIFCPTENNPSAAVGVIAANAQTFSHDFLYDSADAVPYPSDGNRFEQGFRGRWRPLAAYAYKASIIPGSTLTGGGQRNYKDAGIYNNFTLFDWKSPWFNDVAKWRVLGTITQYSPDGEPEEMKSPAGIYSTVHSTPDRNVPSIAADNAQFHAIAFESFEWTGNDTTVAHTGSRSYRVTQSVSVAPFANVRATGQILDKGLSVRFWMKVANHDLTEFPPPGSRSVVVYVGAQNFTIGPQFKIAQSGDWTQYEVVPSLGGTPTNGTVNMGITTMLSAGAPFDTVWIDDIRMQPLDAMAGATVIDRRAQRTDATLDDQHFATYNQYTPEGALVRRLVETSRGIRTVAEHERHLTTMSRYNDEAMDDGGQGGGARTRGAGTMVHAYITGEHPTHGQLDESRIDLLDARIGVDGLKTRFFGDRAWHPVDLKKLAELKLDSIGLPSLPVAEKLEGLKRLADLDARGNQLQREAAAETDSTKRAAAMAALDELGAQRGELLRTLGIDEDQWNELRDEAAEAQDATEQDNAK